MMTKTLATLGLVAATALGTNAYAATENLAVDNSTLATAQNVDPFGSDDSISVFGFRGTVLDGLIIDDGLADYYSFTVAANQVLTLSVITPDGYLFTDDPVVGLFGTDGTLLATDDDGGTGYNALLSYSIVDAGVYYVAVSGFADFDFDGVADFDPLDTISTDFLYNLEITAAPVPVPGALLLLGSALAGFAGIRRRC